MRIPWLEYGNTRYKLPDGDTLLGRGDECNVLIDDLSASRQHALIHRSGERLTIRDLGSTNGTLLNGEAIAGQRELTPGDVIGLGGTRLHFGVTEGQPSGMTPAVRFVDQEHATPGVRRASTRVQTTERSESALSVLEELTASHQVLQRPEVYMPLLRQSIDRFVRRVERGDPLKPDDATRLERLAATVAGWFPDGSLDDWAEQVRQRLASCLR